MRTAATAPCASSRTNADAPGSTDILLDDDCFVDKRIFANGFQ